MDRFLVINAVFATAAIFTGLYSRKLTAALAAWFWLAVVHTGLILLAMGQAGAMTVPEFPMLAEPLKMVEQTIDTGIQMAQTYVAVDFANSALVAYFVTTVGTLLVAVLAAFLISSVLTGLAALVTPRKAENHI
jgi:cytidylate kinase